MATATEPPRLSLREHKHAATIAEKGGRAEPDGRGLAAALSLRAAARELGTRSRSGTRTVRRRCGWSRSTSGYRAWARRYRARFLLIYGDPIPGYAAHDPGPTIAPARQAIRRVGTDLQPYRGQI